MSVPAAYLGIILIWSTTPLAIKWSGEDVGFLFGVTGRMLLGAVLCLALIRLLRVELPWHRTAMRTYLAAGIGIYGSMLCVYWGAQYIPSGLIAVLFGLTPLMTGVLAMAWLDERSFTPGKLAGIVAGLAGLVVIFGSGGQHGPLAVQGISAVLVAVLLHSISSVRVKQIGAEVPALAVAAGGLLVAVPLYLVTWWLADGVVPRLLPARAVLSIVYLGVVGSAIGFVLYYYVLKRLAAGRVALITLVTPVTALLLGNVLNDERPGLEVWAGTAVILLGLVMYQRDAKIRVDKPAA